MGGRVTDEDLLAELLDAVEEFQADTIVCTMKMARRGVAVADVVDDVGLGGHPDVEVSGERLTRAMIAVRLRLGREASERLARVQLAALHEIVMGVQREGRN